MIELSPYHEIFYNEWKLDPSSSKYNIIFDQTLSLELSIAQLKSALQRFVADYFLFNCHVVMQENELYFIENTHIAELEIYNNPKNEQIYAFASQPFNLETGPLYRFAVFKNNYNYRVILITHHLIMDGSSGDIFCSEISNYYNQNNYIPALSKAQQQEILRIHTKELNTLCTQHNDENKKFWQQEVTNLDSLNLEELLAIGNQNKINNSAIQQHSPVEEIRFEINNEDLILLKTIAQTYKITPYAYGQNIFAALLNYYTNQDNFAISYPLLIKNGIALVCGVRVNTSFKLYRFNPSTTIIDLIKANKEFNHKLKDSIFNRAYLPIHKLIKANNNYLLNVGFAETNLKDTPFNFIGVKVLAINSEYNLDYTGNLIIESQLKENNISYRVKYNKLTTNKPALENFLCHYRQLFIAVLHDLANGIIDKPLKDYQILSNNEYQQLIYDFNQTTKAYPREKTIHQLFEEQAKQTPNNIALVFENTKFTYQELNEKANQLAHYILSNYSIQAEDTIALLLERNQDIIIAILAVLKTGCAYIPIDPNIPFERLTSIANDAKPKLIICHQQSSNQLESLQFEKFVLTTTSINTHILSQQRATNPNIAIKQTQLAYIIYTSGTTGKPKGVMIEHHNVVNTIFSLEYLYKSNKPLRLTGFANYVFDASVLEMWVNLFYGNELHLLNEQHRLDTNLLSKYLEDKNINFIPFLSTKVLKQLPVINYKQLRGIGFGGEAHDQELLEKWKNSGKIYNVYGTTETGIFATLYQINQDCHKQIIGKPLNNFQAYVLNKNLQPLPVNAIGELYIAGASVGRGYLNNPELTQQKFIANPFYDPLLGNDRMYATGDLVRWYDNGNLEYIARCDKQVKIRGYRIELLEISHYLSQYPTIIDAVTVVKNIAGNTSKKIIAYYVSNSKLNEKELLSYLANYLPHYMIPDCVMQIEAIPIKSTSGKLDEELLPEPLLNSLETIIAPRNNLESTICNAYAETLDLPNNQISINHDFFNLGGDSLLTISLVIKLQEHINISVNDIFKLRTPAKIADSCKLANKSLEEKLNEIKQFYKQQTKHSLEEQLVNNLNQQEYLKKAQAIQIIQKTKPIQNVLLTGATGHLGCNLLYQLLHTTNYHIYLLARAVSDEEAYNRVDKKYIYYFANDLSIYQHRITVLAADIEQEKLAINDESYQFLLNNIDCIIHAAALVKHYGSYEDFYLANTQATINLLELCRQTKLKDFHYVSTYSVVCEGYVTNHSNYVFNETSDLSILQLSDNHYIKTKYLGELETIKYRKYGINSSIYRVGNLAMVSFNGQLQENIEENAFSIRMKVMLKLGIIAKEFTQVEISPVDITALGIVKLFDKENISNMTHHVFNPYKIDLSTLFKIHKQLAMKSISIIQFIDEIQNRLQHANDTTQIELFMLHQGWLNFDINEQRTRINVIAEQTNLLLQQLDVDWRICNNNLVFNYINKLKSSIS